MNGRSPSHKNRSKGQCYRPICSDSRRPSLTQRAAVVKARMAALEARHGSADWKLFTRGGACAVLPLGGKMSGRGTVVVSAACRSTPSSASPPPARISWQPARFFVDGTDLALLLPRRRVLLPLPPEFLGVACYTRTSVQSWRPSEWTQGTGRPSWTRSS